MGTIELDKVVRQSAVLGRVWHADVARLGETPSVLVLHFGGSGISRERYERRATTRNPVFDEALTALAKEGQQLVFAFVTAPFDLPYRFFHERPEPAARWRAHVEGELMALAPQLPVFLLGYSGGIELALRGPHGSERVVGVGGLGADVVSADLETAPALCEERPLVLAMNTGDPVYQPHGGVLEELLADELVQVRRGSGGHAVTDYVANGAFAGMLRTATTLAASRGR